MEHAIKGFAKNSNAVHAYINTGNTPDGADGALAILCGHRKGVRVLCDYSALAMCANCAHSFHLKARDGMAKAFFASAWADMVEENGASLAGLQIFDVMPKRIDSAAWHAADTLIGDMMSEANVELLTLYWRHSMATTGSTKGERLTMETWGHYCAMQSMGHGVGLFDYGINYKPPYVEFGQHSLSLDYTFNRKGV